MTIIDWALVAIIAISTVFSIWRGATREVLSLTTWVVAGLLAFRFHGLFANILSQYVESPVLSALISALIIIVAVVIVGTLLGGLIAKGIARVGLGPIDKLFGMVFGALRGALIIIVPVMMLQATEIPSEPWWKKSKLLPFFQGVSTQITDWFSANGGSELMANVKAMMPTMTDAGAAGSDSSSSSGTDDSAAPTMPSMPDASGAGAGSSSSDGSSTPPLQDAPGVPAADGAKLDKDATSQVIMPNETPAKPKPADGSSGGGTTLPPGLLNQL